MNKLTKKTLFFFIFFLIYSKAFSEIVNKIEIFGNKRISAETITMFSDVKIQQNLNQNEVNNILKSLYDTNFFSNVEVSFKNNVLKIKVKENPIIENIFYNGVKSNRILDIIKDETSIKSRSSPNCSLITLAPTKKARSATVSSLVGPKPGKSTMFTLILPFTLFIRSAALTC